MPSFSRFFRFLALYLFKYKHFNKKYCIFLIFLLKLSKLYGRIRLLQIAAVIFISNVFFYRQGNRREGITAAEKFLRKKFFITGGSFYSGYHSLFS